ncbi:diiron oxygenase [Tsukamurella sp. 8F]|uniref:AurF N-oxygenase family protein n=1 Tax=unclassified Tsukamurella TaxID=2633480 RepID=UPI0023B9FE75|nr:MULTISPECIES: diiron oxygenase [unclassified Tsukamurella]MDF0529745.1 diiron oxygenase [Tsukamurella sp. 8J]MDF0586030.1 diiron oxygenase [Tsukamurella sp. 8F]
MKRMHSQPFPGQAEYEQTLMDLSEASVRRNFDPYLDIDWDSDALEIKPDDERWICDPDVDPIGRHPWYKAQPVEKQIEMGMWRQANVAKVGLQFESMLIRGIMQYTAALPNNSPEFRYATHEAKEECQHTLMFQEFVNRVGMDVPGGNLFLRTISPIVPLFATMTPMFFYMMVLGGEEPIDHLQKEFLRSKGAQHPAMTTIMQIHVAEEARHIGFAHQLLEHRVPTRGRLTRLALSLILPVTMRVMVTMIMMPPKQFWDRFEVPRDVKREIFWRSPESQRTKRNVYGDVRMMAERSGLMNPLSRFMWRLSGIDGRISRFRSEPTYAAH